MPITRRQFDLGIDEALEAWMRRIHDYLASHRTEAFKLDELLSALGLSNVGPDYRHVTEALAKLEEVGAIELRRVRYDEYYAYSHDLPRLR